MKRSFEKTPMPLLVSVILSAAVCGAMPALAADVSFTPSLSVSEEFNDNILDSAVDRKSEFVTRVQPGASVIYHAPAAHGDLSYSFDYQNYARGTRENEENHYLNLRGRAELAGNFLFLEVSDTLSRVSLDVARDVTTESLHANQTDQNRGSFSPYLLWRFGEHKSLKTGYRFTDTSYWGGAGIDEREHKGFAELSLEPAARLSLTAGYTFGTVTTDVVDYDQHDVNSGFRYEYSESSFLYGGIGNSWQSFSDARNTSNLFWHAGVNRTFNSFAATLEARVLYADDPLTVSTKETTFTARLEKTLQYGVLGVSSAYSKFVDIRAGALDRRRAALNGVLRYELSPRLNASLSLVGDKTSRNSLEDYPYHLSGSTGFSYSFNYDITASLNYSYVDYRRELDSASESRQTNRVLLTVRMAYQ